MNKFLSLFGVLFLIAATDCSPRSLPEDEVCHERRCVVVEVTKTPQAMQRGLQNRLFLSKEEGMLFVFPDNGRHAFWMKDTLIPLDMIWMDYSKRIVHIEENVPPCKSDPCPVYSPPADVDSLYVLEINAGQSRPWGINVGDALEFRLNSF